jgi:hypothetical protein
MESHSLINAFLKQLPASMIESRFRGLFTPTLALPHRGGGNFLSISIYLPSPLAGEGRENQR